MPGRRRPTSSGCHRLHSRALALVKQAAAETNVTLGLLEARCRGPSCFVICCIIRNGMIMDRDRLKGLQVREIRLRLDLSQERFARLLGVSLQSVRRWEAGVTRPQPVLRSMLDQLERTTEGKPSTGDELARGARESEGRGRSEGELGFILKGLGSFFDLAAKLASEATEEDGEVVHRGEGRSPGGGLGYLYGFTVRTGPGGRPIIDQFGNIRRTESGSIVSETREPVVEVLDERDEVVVIAELPGVEEQQIDVAVRAGGIEVSAAGRGRRYHKRVLLPSPVIAGSLTSSYRNGILEIRCRKAGVEHDARGD